MTYDIFTKHIEQEVVKYLPKAWENPRVMISKAMKINRSVDALTIWREDGAFAPTIYLNDYYELYQHGKSMEQILEQIGDNYCSIPAETAQVLEQELAQPIAENLYAVLISADRNQELLQKTPHKCFHDLAIIARWELRQGEMNGAVTITYEVAKGKQLDAEIVVELAIQNTIAKRPSCIYNLAEVVEKLSGEPMNDCLPMYVLSNEDTYYGAIYMAVPEVLQAFARVHGSFMILPSSLHELILVPESQSPDFEELKNMIQDINTHTLEEEDILSDHAYYYDAVSKEIRTK